MEGFWSDIIDDSTGPPLTDAMVQTAEQNLGFKLPKEYVELLRTRNGGYPRLNCFATSAPTSWAPDHIQISTLFGIGYPRGIEASRKIISVWGYPSIGLVITDTPSGCHDAIMLDYSICGPSGDPRVVLVEPREVSSDVTLLSLNFDEFVSGLVHSAHFQTDGDVAQPGEGGLI
jgi:hypothetical protein